MRYRPWVVSEARSPEATDVWHIKAMPDSYKLFSAAATTTRHTGWQADPHRARSLKAALAGGGQADVEIDLEWLGTDATVLHRLSPDVALAYGTVPVCEMDGQLILAVSECRAGRARKELPALLGKKIRFVLADVAVIAATIETNYSPMQLTA